MMEVKLENVEITRICSGTVDDTEYDDGEEISSENEDYRPENIILVDPSMLEVQIDNEQEEDDDEDEGGYSDENSLNGSLSGNSHCESPDSGVHPLPQEICPFCFRPSASHPRGQICKLPKLQQGPIVRNLTSPVPLAYEPHPEEELYGPPSNKKRNLSEELFGSPSGKKQRLSVSMSKGKIVLGTHCPICDQELSKQHGRVHVLWHYMKELTELAQALPNPQQCSHCSYHHSSIKKMAQHIGQGHSKLDELLLDETLLDMKRAESQIKPEKLNMGSKCTICDKETPTREHVARHFMEELMSALEKLPDNMNCFECPYSTDKPKNLAIHRALVHGLLDSLLKNSALVQSKRVKHDITPKKVSVGRQCLICDMEFSSTQNVRVHIYSHFSEDLRSIIQNFPNPYCCMYCGYTNDRLDCVAKHVAFGHSKLDELLKDKDLIEQKRVQALSTPKRVSIGAFCPICGKEEACREHVARHFHNELMDIVQYFPNPLNCPLCKYSSDKVKMVAIHFGLMHGKLDEFLQNAELMEEKRNEAVMKPQKLTIGPVCPICGITFTSGQSRHHVASHYMNELRSIVNGFPNSLQCPQCSYTSDTVDKVSKHMALGHSLLDQLLTNEDLLKQKQIQALTTTHPVNVTGNGNGIKLAHSGSTGVKCPVCDTENVQRSHISRHFTRELVDIVSTFENPNKCSDCDFGSKNSKNVAIHVSLVHGILEQLLEDHVMVQNKRKHYIKPKLTSNPQYLITPIQLPELIN